MFDDRMTDDLVEQLHARLVDALRRLRPDPFGSPVTVAEIYQDLVPYRSVRTELGFDMNADYEHTLLRMLAGESDLARLDPPEARDELRSELDSPNPNVGLFRKFAACDVWITRTAATEAPPAEPPADTWDPRGLAWDDDADGAADEPVADATGSTAPATDATSAPADDTLASDAGATAEAMPPEAGWTEERAETELLLEEAIEVPESAVSPQPASEFQREETPMPTPHHAEAAATGAAAAERTAVCSFCDSDLPAHRAIRFCPFCGADQQTTPCVACGEPIEAGWKFCIACGAEAPAAAMA